MPSYSLRRARVSAMLAFATNGALPASFLARYAEVKEQLGVGDGLFGLLVVGMTIGGAAAFHLPAVVLRRFGTPRTTAWGTVWVALAVLLAATGVVTGHAWLFFVGLFCAGLGDACVDVGQNSQGLRVQEGYGRSLLNFMHAGWSIGAAVGGAVGTVLAIIDVPLLAHVALWGGLCVVAMFVAASGFIPEAGPAAEEAPASGLSRRAIVKFLVPLALVALAGITVEDLGNNWSAVLLATERDVPIASAGIALSVMLGAQFIGRLLGDRVVDRIGDSAALRISLVMILVGVLGAAWAPNMALTLVAFALAGLGCAVTVPIAFARADAVPGLPPHSGVTWVSWAMRAATICLSPLTGGLSAAFSLPLAMSVLSLIAVVALIFQLRERRASATS
ncbi:MFS transporter [Zhihengliuella flava]|uniref:Fucose permease n=1 Tax=Zhihengliuella flava TaxID=1285193 RepID=A0A931D9F9_9MICC|nr:MFS transporter [Zhihengliuella flava]MBG6084862.1 fucose permease [Zhihengliuella flava]